MGFFQNIAKRRVDRQRKKRADDLYKRRDIKLDKALKAGKVTDKQKTALGKGGTKKYRDKFGPKVGLPRQIQNRDLINQLNTDWKK